MIHVRPGERDDLPHVLRMWHALMRGAAESDPRYQLRPNAEAAMRSYVRNDWLASYHPFPALWIASVDGAVAGFLSIRVEPDNPVIMAAPTATIGDLWVEPASRRRRVGQTLVSVARTTAREAGYARLSLGTLVRDARAVAFWTRQGFDPMYVRMVADVGSSNPTD
jgi:GNAT superfamily N-acetyltransferase